MILKAIHAAAVSAAFAFAIGASTLSVQADTGTVDAYDRARCEEAKTTGNAFLMQQFCETWEIRSMTTNGRSAQKGLTLEQMNCASSNESNKIPCAAKGRI
jgi:hypothetical protein